MPKVGKMKFPYTEQGMKEAASYAKNSGKPMQIEGSYRHGGMVPKYQAGGMIPSRPNPMGGPFEPPIKRAGIKQNAPQGFSVQNYSGPPPYGPHRQRTLPNIAVPGPGPVSPRPPGAGMRPPVNPGTMGGRMNPGMRRALMNRLAKFKKGTV